VPQIFFGLTRLATLLPSLGWAKLVRHSWIWIPKQSLHHEIPLIGVGCRCGLHRQDLDHEHATLVTDWAFPQRRAGEFFIALGIARAGF
jgi:hypothetical protein